MTVSGVIGMRWLSGVARGGDFAEISTKAAPTVCILPFLQLAWNTQRQVTKTMLPFEVGIFLVPTLLGRIHRTGAYLLNCWSSFLLSILVFVGFEGYSRSGL